MIGQKLKKPFGFLSSDFLIISAQNSTFDFVGIKLVVRDENIGVYARPDLRVNTKNKEKLCEAEQRWYH